ncbi:MAG: pantoate--beta-alanine ligase [Phycisphaerales bacterium]|nr:pantoate--beta-alanine ligase [Phycisphaerales bacterium]
MSLQVIHEKDQLAALEGMTFVPTMGALHDGHLSLVRAGLALGDQVLMSIYVNPTQFAPDEDFEAYPRPIDEDLAKAEAAGAQAVFIPDTSLMYPAGEEIACPPLPSVATEPGLEDAHRPHFFTGVCTVVARLLDLVRPHRMIMGEKDYQQLLVLQAMVDADRQRWPNIKVIGSPTIREPDGLAMSSRNAYLDEVNRDRALGLSLAMQAAAKEPDVASAEARMQSVLEEHQLRVDYAVVRDSRTLMPVEGSVAGHRALIAAHLDTVRLIDNRSF